MNKVITINLAGTAYQLEEAGYDALRAYLDHAARQLAANPDRDEILADIEGAVAEKCRTLLTASRNVVGSAEIARIIAEMGPVTDSSAAADHATPGSGSSSAHSSSTAHSAAGTSAHSSDSSASSSSSSSSSGTTPGSPPNAPRRIYLLPEGAMIGGVCNGLAAYFGIDPIIVRALFVLFTFFTLGFTILFYFGLMMALPTAHSPDEKAAAYGTASATTQEFIRRAREGYYRGMRTFHDKAAHREWKRKFRREMRGWRTQFHQNMAHQSHAWQQSWQTAGAPPAPPAPPPHPDWSLWLAAPFFAVLKTILTLAAVLAVISLIATGKFFTHPLPADVPVWLAVVLVIIVYQLLAMPFHALRHAYRYSTGYGVPCLSPFASFFGTVCGLAILFASLWYCDRHIPEFHAFLHKIPPALNSLIDALRGWWAEL